MNPYTFLAKLAGIGLVAGTAVAMVKLVEKVWPKPDDEDSTFEYIAVAGEFPPEDEETGETGKAEEAGETNESALVNDAGCAAEPDTVEPADAPALESTVSAAPIAPATPAAAAASDAPNENPVDAPPAVPVTDPLKIADPADFQDWDELGCQG